MTVGYIEFKYTDAPVEEVRVIEPILKQLSYTLVITGNGPIVDYKVFRYYEHLSAH